MISGRMGIELSHPWRKDKNAPRMGHPELRQIPVGLVDLRVVTSGSTYTGFATGSESYRV